MLIKSNTLKTIQNKESINMGVKITGDLIEGKFDYGDYYWENYNKFLSKLDALKNNDEQIVLQLKALKNVRIGSILLVGSGLILAAAAAALLMQQWLIAISLIVACCASYIFGTKFLFNSVSIYKEQQTKHFLNSIRIAKNTYELDWCGLFTYYEGTKESSQSNEDIKNSRKEIRKIINNLKKALNEDEGYLES